MESSGTNNVGIFQNSFFMSEPDQKDSQTLYNFIGLTNKLVNQARPGLVQFNIVEQLWRGELPKDEINQDVRQAVAGLKELADKYNFDRSLVEKYLNAKKNDFYAFKYENFDELEDYMEGAAESVGLIIARILGLPRQADEFVRYQSAAVIFFNFIKNLDLDSYNGRYYFPALELRRFGLPYPNYDNAYKHPGAFREFIEAQLKKHNALQKQASKGFKYLPYAKRVGLRIMVDINQWQSNKISKNPFLLFEEEIKPSRFRYLRRAMVRFVNA